MTFAAVASWLGWAVFVSALVCILVLPWLAIFRRSRGLAGGAYVAASYVFGATLWIMCLLTVWDVWGGFWAAVGVLVLGVGVLPMSLVIFALASQWALFIEVLLIAAVALGVRLLGVWLIAKSK